MMRNTMTIGAGGLALLVCAGLSAAAEFEVSNPEEFKKAVKKVQPGDVVVMSSGVWKDANLTFEGEGTAANPITLRARVPGKTVLTGRSTLRLGGEFLSVEGLLFTDGHVEGGHAVAFRINSDRPANNSRLTQCAFIDYNPPSRDTNSYWVSLYGKSNRVDHCLFRNKTDASPTLTVWVESEPNYHLIDRNNFTGRPPLGRNGGETLRVGTSEVSLNNSRTVVEFNYFEDCSGEAEYISNKSCENTYRHNTFFECQGALVLRHGHRTLVEGNYFLGNHRPGTGGVRIINEDQWVVNNYFHALAGTNFESTLPFVNGIPDSKLNEYYQIKNAVIAFNTAVDCAQNITFGVGVGFRNRALPPVGCTIANNIVVGTNGPLVLVQDEPVGTRWMGNIFHGAATGLPEHEGIRNVDPKLTKGADGLWRPSADSPALGAAVGEFGRVKADIFGRPRSENKDVGCMQGTSGSPKHGPLTASDVGPRW